MTGFLYNGVRLAKRRQQRRMLSSQSGCLSKWPAFVFTDHKRLLVKTVSLIIRRSPSDLMWTAVLAYVTSLTTTIYWNSILLWWPCCSEVGLTINVGVQTPFSILMTGNSLQVTTFDLQQKQPTRVNCRQITNQHEYNCEYRHTLL